jgi:hypothetical protein
LRILSFSSHVRKVTPTIRFVQLFPGKSTLACQFRLQIDSPAWQEHRYDLGGFCLTNMNPDANQDPVRAAGDCRLFDGGAASKGESY